MSVNINISDAADPFARGRQIGSRWRRQIGGTVDDYAWLFEAAGLAETVVRSVALECQDQLRDWAPELAAEIDGIGDGAGLSPWQVAALTARTEILVRGSIAGLSECTAAAWLPPQGPPHTVQTWDWIPQVDNFTVLRHTSAAGLRVVTFAENGVIGKVGVNSAGLGVLFTLLCHTSDGSTSGVPVHAVARQILDTATDVEQAIEIATGAPICASASLTLLHWDGTASTGAVVEISPAGSAVLPPEDGYLLHTNHFLDPDLANGDRLAAIDDDTLPRLRVLRERRSVLSQGDRTQWAAGLRSHWEDGAPICAHPRPGAAETDRWETKMMFGLDLAVPSLHYHPGGPCRVSETGWTEVAA